MCDGLRLLRLTREVPLSPQKTVNQINKSETVRNHALYAFSLMLADQI